jgi:hypothetical protein
MGLLNSLQQRWNLKNIRQVIVILVVFACTGFTILFLKKPLVSLISSNEEHQTILTILYYIFILPIYNVVLLLYGFLFGEFKFFWSFEKKMWYRMSGQKHKIESE